MQRWQVGEVRITRVIEQEDDSMPAEIILPDAQPEVLLPIPWLRPHFITEEGALITAIHSLLVETDGKRLVVDTCLGNDKPRAVPNWNERQGAFLSELAQAGFERESVDYVVCTHLHPDHVGWNTMLVDGAWVPTFPNARYLFTRPDWEWLDKEPVTELGDFAGDSVRPIFEAGLADLIEPGHRLNEEVWFESTPGHSPGHISVCIESAGQKAVITGDLIQHPSHVAYPNWASTFDFDPDLARRSRHAFLERHGGGGVLVIGTHFATPTAGRIVSDEEHGYRFEV